MHFSWRKNHTQAPHLSTVLEGSVISIKPPKYIRWLGFYLDRKLTFKHHVDILCAKAKNIISGLSCLGNTIAGMNQNHLRLLYKTCVIPVITYGSQLWFNPYHPRVLLMKKLEKIQNLGLRKVTGAFRTSNTEALTLLAHQPPIHITVHKLFESCAARFFRLPLHSEITLRLPPSFIPKPEPRHILVTGGNLAPRTHIPFFRPAHLKDKPKKNPQKFSQITLLASTLKPDTERQLPYHDHCHPAAFCTTSPLFKDRLDLDWKPCDKKERRSLVAAQNMRIDSAISKPSRLVVFSDGSKIDPNGTGYGVAGYHNNQEVITRCVKFSKEASNFDAEMYAIAEASEKILEYVTNHAEIRIIYMFSDNSGAIKTIFDPTPHPSQAASIRFREAIFSLFTLRPNIKLSLEWTPGHAGTDKMKRVDKLAKKAAKAKGKSRLYKFTSLSHALMMINTINPLQRWKDDIDDNPIKESSFFFGASYALHPHLKPPKWFKPLNRPITSRLTQFATGHAYTAEYFERFHIPNKRICLCANDSPEGQSYPPVTQTREHIIKGCPLYEDARNVLRISAPRIDDPRWHSSNLLREEFIEHFIIFLTESWAMSKKHSLASSEPNLRGKQRRRGRINRQQLPTGSLVGQPNQHGTPPTTAPNQTPVLRTNLQGSRLRQGIHQSDSQTSQKRTHQNSIADPQEGQRQDQGFRIHSHHSPIGQDRRSAGPRPHVLVPRVGIRTIRSIDGESPSRSNAVSPIQPIDQPKDPTPSC